MCSKAKFMSPNMISRRTRCVQRRKAILPLVLEQEPVPSCRESYTCNGQSHPFRIHSQNLHIKTCSHHRPCIASSLLKGKGRRSSLGPHPAVAPSRSACPLPQSTLITWDDMPCAYWNSPFTTLVAWLTHFANLNPAIHYPWAVLPYTRHARTHTHAPPSGPQAHALRPLTHIPPKAKPHSTSCCSLMWIFPPGLQTNTSAISALPPPSTEGG